MEDCVFGIWLPSHVRMNMAALQIGLYYGSLDLPRASALLRAWFVWPFLSRIKVESELAEAVRAELELGQVFAYASARGALAAALRAGGICKDDEVVLSGFTCLAVPTAVVSIGAKPVYIDIDPLSLNMNPDAVLAALGPRVRAVILQHTMGSVAEVDFVVQVARNRGIIVIEDCALATGTRRQGFSVGINADAAIFSMELSKTISTGWGGILVVQSPAIVESVRRQYDKIPTRGILSTSRDAWQIALTGLFLNHRFFRLGRYACAIAFKLSIFRSSTPVNELAGIPSIDFIARMGLPQLRLATHQWRRLPSVRAVSGRHVRLLQEALQSVRLRAVGVAPLGDEPVTPRVCFLVRSPDRTIAWFSSRGVEVGRWFSGPLSPPPTSDAFCYDPALIPNAVQVARQIVNLPSHCGMTVNDCTRLIALIFDYAAEYPEECIE
jgi:perosamine synthetase